MINTRSSALVDNLDQFVFHILGCGAIGSSAALQLARMGADQFCLYDMDKVEAVNIGVSQYTLADINKSKVDALEGHIMSINDNSQVYTYNERFTEYYSQGNNDVAILGFDSMESRLQAVEALCVNKHVKPEFLIDGRMGAEHYQQYIFDKPTLSKYKKTWYSDSNGSPEPCNAKATAYCSSMSGSFIANAVRKLATGQPFNRQFSFNFPTMLLEKSVMVS
jgi:molybdopterin/thiamine biosynthesis adenylyltransferase